MQRSTLFTASVLYGAYVLRFLRIIFRYVFCKLAFLDFFGDFLLHRGKNSGGKQGGVNKVSCRRGDPDFALQEGVT